MATKTLKARYCVATKTESEWANSNPILLKGEVAFSSDKGYIFKVGDGTSNWEDLEYANQGPKGDKGDTGATGAKGDTGATGATGKTGPGVTATSTDVTVTASSFSSAAPYTQTITVSGILTTDQIIIGFLPITASAEKAETKAFGCLSTASCTTNGQLILTCNTSKPATNFKIRVLCFRTVAAA